jgi:hypothetical protein
MKSSKLLTLMEKLSGSQMARLELFLESPYFNQGVKVLEFFRVLKALHPRFPEEEVDKLTFPARHLQGEITEKQLPGLLSQLLKLTEQFLALEEWQKDERDVHYALLKGYYRLDRPVHYRSAKRKAEQNLKEEAERDAAYFYQKLRHRLLELRHRGAETRDFRPNLQQTMDALDIYYLAQKMQLVGEMRDAERTLSIQYEKRLPPALLNWFEQAPFQSVSLLKAYQLFYQFLDREDDITYHKLRKLLKESEKDFTPSDLYYFYVGLMNYQARRINRKGEVRAYHEYLSLNEFMLEKGWLFQDGILSPWIYKNLVGAALNVGKTNWANDFLEKYRSFLPEDYAQDIYAFAKADYFYHLKNYDKAQKLLIDLSPRDVILNINARSLLIRTYFETRQEELLLSYLEATRVYLIRNKLIDEDRKKQMLKFVEITAKITRTASFEKEKRKELLKLLPPPKEVMHQQWLKEKLLEQL